MQEVDFFSDCWRSQVAAGPELFIYDEGGEGNMAQMTDDVLYKGKAVNINNVHLRKIWFLPVDHKWRCGC